MLFRLYLRPFNSTRRDAGAVERARLESVCAPKGYRGFESLSLRIKKADFVKQVGFFFNPLVRKN